MTTKEIYEREKDIALMLGLVPLDKPYLKAYTVNENTHNSSFYYDRMEDECWYIHASYNSDWNWLFEALTFISKQYHEGFPITYTIGSTGCVIDINATNASGDVFKGNKRIANTLNINYLILDENKQFSQIEAVFIAVSDFAKQYNLSKSNE